MNMRKVDICTYLKPEGLLCYTFELDPSRHDQLWLNWLMDSLFHVLLWVINKAQITPFAVQSSWPCYILRREHSLKVGSRKNAIGS